MPIAGVINTGSHPKFLWPGIHDIWGRFYNEHPEEFPMLFGAMHKSTMNYEEEPQIIGFGLMPVKPEGSATQYVSEVQGPVARYTHLTYSMGYIVTKEELEDDLYEKVSGSRARSLAFSARQTEENVCANIYNRGFNSSFVGPDGVSLFNTAHPNTSGGTFSNMLAVGADLSEASLEDLVVQIMGATDDVGNLISLMPKRLLVPRQEVFNAARILKSVGQSGTANNDINALKAANAIPEGAHVNHYFTAPHAWFILTNCPNGVQRFDRVAISFTQDNDFDTDNAKAKNRMRYSVGWSDSRGAFGSNGP